MLDLTVSEEFILPVSLERACEVCERALIECDWCVREKSPTTFLAREKGLLGIEWLGTKTLTTPVDLSVLLSEAANGTCVRLNATLTGAKIASIVFRPLIQGKITKIQEFILAEIQGFAQTPSLAMHDAARGATHQPPELPQRQPVPEDQPQLRTAGRIFISYRRKDSADVAGRIYDRLIAHFGEGAVFQDVEDIPLGMDFSEHINRVVSTCDAFLAIIGLEWLDVADAQGARRLDNPADNVRIEIESALHRKIPLIPVLVRGASMPREDALPETLRKLAYRNATQVRPNPDFRSDMARLIEGLEELISRRP